MMLLQKLGFHPIMFQPLLFQTILLFKELIGSKISTTPEGRVLLNVSRDLISFMRPDLKCFLVFGLRFSSVVPGGKDLLLSCNYFAHSVHLGSGSAVGKS